MEGLGCRAAARGKRRSQRRYQEVQQPRRDFSCERRGPELRKPPREACLKEGEGSKTPFPVVSFRVVPLFPHIPVQKSLTFLRMNFLYLNDFLF